jgi:xylulokinase
MYSLGLDIGSSSIKAAIIDIANGKAVSSVKYPELEMKIHSPHKNWAEQEPEDWWIYVQEAIKKALSEANIKAIEIGSIGISYQMHGLVAVDVKGIPVRPSIIWCDSRAIQSGAALSSNLGENIFVDNLYNKLGNFTASKLFWVKENEPETYARIHKVMLPGDYIAYKLSGIFSSTYSGMSEGIFFDFKNYEISKDVLNAAGFDADIFPKCGNSFDILCTTNKAAQESIGFKEGTPISYRAGDQPNNAFALGVINSGEAAATGGTSGVVYSVSNDVKYDHKARVNSFAHVNHTSKDSKIGTLLCINGTGILYNWIRTNNFNDISYVELEKIASAIPIGSDGLINLPFGNGAERMLANKVIGASLNNIDFNRHTKAHVVRSGLEGIAFAFNYGIEAMKELGIDVCKIRAGNDNLFQSAIFSKTFSTLSNVEIGIYETTGAIGAAKGAAFGAGFYKSLEEATENISLINTISPDLEKEAYYTAYENWKNNLNQKLQD